MVGRARIGERVQEDSGLKGQLAPFVDGRQAHVALEEIGGDFDDAPARLGQDVQQGQLFAAVGVVAGQLARRARRNG